MRSAERRFKKKLKRKRHLKEIQIQSRHIASEVKLKGNQLQTTSRQDRESGQIFASAVHEAISAGQYGEYNK